MIKIQYPQASTLPPSHIIRTAILEGVWLQEAQLVQAWLHWPLQLLE